MLAERSGHKQNIVQMLINQATVEDMIVKKNHKPHFYMYNCIHTERDIGLNFFLIVVQFQFMPAPEFKQDIWV